VTHPAVRVRRRLVLVALAALLLAGAVATPASARPGSVPERQGRKPKPSTTTTTTTWPPLPAFDPALVWTDCGDGFQCGTVTVPADWRAPSSAGAGSAPADTVPLALIRHPAESPADRIGSLVVNYGGPGESGVDYLRVTWSRLPAVVRARFDVVSFDPRGTGASRPIDCVDDAFLDLGTAVAPVPTTAAQLDVVHRYNQQFAAGCVQRMGAYAGEVGTRNVARDLEAIRIALGEPKLDYLGYSYGTIVGITYAQMFPTTIRTMVLDGPPDYWLPARDYAYQQARGFMNALSAFLDWCDQTHCSLASAGSPRDVLQQLIGRVDQAPLPATYTSDGVTRDGTLTPNLLESAVLSMLYDRSRGWPILADSLAQAVQEGSGAALLQLADQYLGRRPDGAWKPLVEANAVIGCVDRPTKKAPTTATELADVATFQAQLPPWGGAWATAVCVGMPKPAKGDVLGDVKVRSAPPILVIGTTGDPAAPYAGAQSMTARIAGSQLLTFDSTEHTAYGRAISTCIDDAVDTYLLGGALPPAGTHCAPD
jgi:pimeloyl-ACP methyl ester carboxylesterase